MCLALHSLENCSCMRDGCEHYFLIGGAEDENRVGSSASNPPRLYSKITFHLSKGQAGSFFFVIYSLFFSLFTASSTQATLLNHVEFEVFFDALLSPSLPLYSNPLKVSNCIFLVKFWSSHKLTLPQALINHHCLSIH